MRRASALLASWMGAAARACLLRVGLAAAALVSASAAFLPPLASFTSLAEARAPCAAGERALPLLAALVLDLEALLPLPDFELPCLVVAVADANAAPGAASISADAAISAASRCPLRGRNGGF